MVKLETALGEITISGLRCLKPSWAVPSTNASVWRAWPPRTPWKIWCLFSSANRLDKGVRVIPAGEDMVSIELHIVVIYGLNIAAVSSSIVNRVRYTVEELTGLTVHEVTICVDDMKA